jgi:hypothetical protein
LQCTLTAARNEQTVAGHTQKVVGFEKAAAGPGIHGSRLRAVAGAATLSDSSRRSNRDNNGHPYSEQSHSFRARGGGGGG